MKKILFTSLIAFVCIVGYTSCKKCVTCHTEGNNAGPDIQKHCAQSAKDIDAFTASYAAGHNGFDTHAICD